MGADEIDLMIGAVVRRHAVDKTGFLAFGNDARAGHSNGRRYARAQDKTGSAVAYQMGDNGFIWGNGDGWSRGGRGDLAAGVRDNNLALAPAASPNRTSPGGALVPWSPAATEGDFAIGPNLSRINLRKMELEPGGRLGACRDGTEAVAVIGSTRAYKNGDEVRVVASGGASAGVTGNTVWVRDPVHGEVTWPMCECTSRRRGKSCHCDCHEGAARWH